MVGRLGWKGSANPLELRSHASTPRTNEGWPRLPPFTAQRGCFPPRRECCKVRLVYLVRSDMARASRERHCTREVVVTNGPV